MKRLTYILTILFIAATSAVAQHLKIDYDRFKDETSVMTEITGAEDIMGRPLDNLPAPVGFQFMIGHQGKAPIKPKVVVILYTHPQMSMWRSNSELNLICDGERLNLGSMKVQSTGLGLTNYMLLSLVVPYETYKKIALSKVVEVRIGNAKEFTLSDKSLKKIRELIQYAEPTN